MKILDILIISLALFTMILMIFIIVRIRKYRSSEKTEFLDLKGYRITFIKNGRSINLWSYELSVEDITVQLIASGYTDFSVVPCKVSETLVNAGSKSLLTGTENHWIYQLQKALADLVSLTEKMYPVGTMYAKELLRQLHSSGDIKNTEPDEDYYVLIQWPDSQKYFDDPDAVESHDNTVFVPRSLTYLIPS